MQGSNVSIAMGHGHYCIDNPMIIHILGIKESLYVNGSFGFF